MNDDKAYFRIYGEKVRAKSKAPKGAGRNTPDWFNYQIDGLCDLNPLRKFLNVGGIPLSLKNDKEGFIRNIKKTQPKQIKYLLEDMDEEVRRLKDAVLYVGFCNRQYKTVLKNEEKALEEKMNRLQKVLRNSADFENTSEPTGPENKSIPGTSNSRKGIDRKNYTITHQMSNATPTEEDFNEQNFVIDNFSEGGNEAIREADCNGKGNYLLRQLQRQLLEMNNKLKVMKMEYDSLGQEQSHKELVVLKKGIREQKENRKAHMLTLHKLNERFLEKNIKVDRVGKLVKR